MILFQPDSGKIELNIPVEALGRGADLARDNAWQFLRDAELLLSHESHGHAIALALYGVEEHAKMWVLKAMRIQPALRDELSERIAMRKHVEKFMVALDVLRAQRSVEVTEQVRQQVIDTAKKLQSLKERGLYVGLSREVAHSRFRGPEDHCRCDCLGNS
jgi:AbiV family abortive infection protein